MADPNPTRFHNPYPYELKNPPSQGGGIPAPKNVDYDELLTEEERFAIADVKQEYEKNVKDFESFLWKEYMDFDMKINRCLLQRCYQSPPLNRASLRECTKNCGSGVKKADFFVSGQVARLHSAFQQCLEEGSAIQKNMFQETIQCYETYTNTFDSVKKEIKKEFDFYK